MSSISRVRGWVGGTVVAVLAAAFLVPGTAGAADAASGPTIQVHISADHRVHMTRQLHPGIHKFVVTSDRTAAFQIVRIRGDYSPAQLVADVNSGLGQGDTTALKRFERHVVLLGGVGSTAHRRGVMYADLDRRGTFWAVDTDAAPLTRGDLLRLHAGGSFVHGSLHGTAHVSAVRSTSWAANPTRIPHRGLLHFVNASADNHFVELFKLRKGKTVADFRRFVDKAKAGQDPGPDPGLSRYVLDTGVVSPGHAETVHYDLPPGHYVLVCWWPDADMGGMPHAFMGMFRGITLR